MSTDADIKQAYVVSFKDGDEWETGAYGALFWQLASQVIKDRGYVCAPIFKHGEVCHVLTDDLEEALRMLGSRGILGRATSAYPGIRKALQSGSIVLFVGTPCQIANVRDGCRESIKHGDGRLITLETACLGLADPFFLDWYLQAVGVAQDQVSNVTTQAIVNHGAPIAVTKILLKDGRCIICDGQEDLYGSALAQGLTLKERCYRCPYLPTKGIGDLLVAPYSNGLAGIATVGPDAAATILVNTTNGQRLWEEISPRLAYQSVPLERESVENPYLCQRPTKPDNRDQFVSDIKTMGLEDLAALYANARNKPKGLRGLIPWL